MHIAKCGPEGNHIQIGVLGEEQTAFQTGVDSQYLGIFAKELAISLVHHLQYFGIGVRLPTGITVTHFNLGSAQFEYGFYHVADIFLQRFGRAALAGFYLYFARFLHFDGGEVGRAFHQIFHVVAHTQYAVRHYVEHTHKALRAIVGNYLVAFVLTFQCDLYIGIYFAEFVLHIALHHINDGRQSLLFIGRNSDYGIRFAWNGIVQISPINRHEVHRHLFHYSIQNACQQLVGIAQSDMYFATGVTALEAIYRDLGEKGVGVCLFGIVAHNPRSAHSAGTSDKHLAFVLTIEVQKDITFDKSRLNTESTGHTGFFVHGKETFDRTVFHAFIIQNGQRGSHSDAIVRT